LKNAVLGALILVFLYASAIRELIGAS